MTRQRKIILEELRKTTSHPSADAIYESVRRQLPNISLGTVYRNLEILSRNGKILKLELCGYQKRFDGNPNPHDHVRCVRCGRIEDLPTNILDDFKGKVCPSTSFEVLGCRLEFSGICPDCKAKED